MKKHMKMKKNILMKVMKGKFQKQKMNKECIHDENMRIHIHVLLYMIFYFYFLIF